MVDDEIFDIAHNLRIALVSVGGCCLQPLAVLLVDGGGLRMQHKWDGQQALEVALSKTAICSKKKERLTYFDPFDLPSCQRDTKSGSSVGQGQQHTN